MERRTRWCRFAGRTHVPVGDPGWSHLILREAPMEGTHVEQLVESCSPRKEPIIFSASDTSFFLSFQVLESFKCGFNVQMWQLWQGKAKQVSWEW